MKEGDRVKVKNPVICHHDGMSSNGLNFAHEMLRYQGLCGIISQFIAGTTWVKIDFDTPPPAIYNNWVWDLEWLELRDNEHGLNNTMAVLKNI